MNNIQRIFTNTLFSSHSLVSEEYLKEMIKECKHIQNQIKTGGDNWNCNTYNTLGTYELTNTENYLLHKTLNFENTL